MEHWFNKRFVFFGLIGILGITTVAIPASVSNSVAAGFQRKSKSSAARSSKGNSQKESSVGGNTRPAGITGGFIQYHGGIMKNRRHKANPLGLSRNAWRREVAAMHLAKMDTIILQCLEGDGEWFIPDPSDRTAVDPTEVILSYADLHAMKVYVGLWSGPWPNDKVVSADPELLSNTRRQNIRVANQAWARYGHHTSFAGWYIPQEVWNQNWTTEENQRMRTFFREVSEHCKEISHNKPVAISPYFSSFGTALDEETVAKVYTAFLKGDEQVKGAGIDVIILQDGVGTRCWNTRDEIIANALPYFRGFFKATQAASEGNKIALWLNAESFKTIEGGCSDNYKGTFKAEPADFSRLKLQIEVASLAADGNPPLFEKIVTFDFFHYMSPVHPGETLAARQRLYNSYIDAYATP
jgi:hypothetical protein